MAARHSYGATIAATTSSRCGLAANCSASSPAWARAIELVIWRSIWAATTSASAPAASRLTATPEATSDLMALPVAHEGFEHGVVVGTQRVPTRHSGHQRESAGHRDFLQEIFGGEGVRRLRPRSAVGAGPHGPKLLRVLARALEVPRKSVGELCAVPLPDQEPSPPGRSDSTVGWWLRRSQDTDPCPGVSCRGVSAPPRAFRTRAYAAEPSLEVAGFEPASSGAAIGLLRAQPASDCRGRYFCRRQYHPVTNELSSVISWCESLSKPY